jgi:membrane associated rhomboid family serine protease
MYSRSTDDGSWQRLALWSGRVQAGQIDISNLSPEEQAKLIEKGTAVRPYRPYQLFTHTLVHGDIMHLVENLVFLLVFGSRVNSLIGQPLTLIVYPLLAVLAGLAQMASDAHGPCIPTIGASGAIMGLAGMYFVFFPLNKVHMLAWIRIFLFLRYKLFALRGFWVVLFYIGLDVWGTVSRSDDGLAHWAHLGGFIFGMAFAVLLMTTRLVNAHGNDILSVVFGRYAWGLIGSPGRAR